MTHVDLLYFDREIYICQSSFSHKCCNAQGSFLVTAKFVEKSAMLLCHKYDLNIYVLNY